MRVVVWFSNGAASAVAAKLVIDRFLMDEVVVVNCDLSKDEHPDNERFKRDVSRWIGRPIITIGSKDYASVEDVWEKRQYMAGIAGAPCTVEMKKVPRFEFQKPDDVHVFGYTADEPQRFSNFESTNPELFTCWVLRDANITKDDCYQILMAAGIELPALYRQGYRNNNCIGCVKATSPAYWNLVRDTYPEIFQRRADQSRRIGARLARLKGKRIFLDELPKGDYGRYKMPNITCGPECAPAQQEGV